MSGFISSNSSYNISTDYQMSVILSHFDTDFIYSTIKNMINSKYYENVDMSNIIICYEENFKQLLSMYTNDVDVQQILDTKNTIYGEIITLLCNEFQLEYNECEADGYDLYTPAFYLFTLLVSAFTLNVKNFFTHSIIKERNNLYNPLQLSQFKREKDSSTIYNKKRIKNSKLAIILSRLNYVIDNICVFDIDFATYVENVCENKNIVNYILRIVSPKNDFFKTYVVPMFDKNSPVRAMIINDINIQLYNQLSNEINLVDYMED